MTAQQLKNAILQEAIEGRLVPQDPNDEPASILLERIRAEKERLVKEGKLKKKDLEVKPISEDEIPFDIPESWEWVRLGLLVSYQNGYAYNSSEMNKEGKGMPVIKSGNLMTLEVVLKPNNDYVEHPSDKMLASKIVKGDMLMCLSSQSDNPEPLGKTAVYNFDTCALLNQRVLKFRPYFDELTSYLFYTINSFYFWYNVSHQGGGSAQANLKLNHVLDMPIPLPPLAEQKRIVAKIEELLPKVEKYGKAQDELNKLNEELPERLKKSILQEAIEGRLVPQDPTDEPASVLLDKIREEKKQLVKEGKLKKKDLEVKPISEEEIPFEIPESWEWVRMSQISLDSADGPFGSNLKRDHYTTNKEVRIIQLSNIGEEGWRDENVKYTTFEHLKNISRSEAFANDIIIAKMMPAGRAIICPSNDQKYVLSSDAVRFDFSDYLFRKYLYYAINSNVFKDQVYGEVQGITRVRTSLSKLRTYLLPLPPLAEQKRIVAKIEQLLKEIDKLK
jgi:type I restriction enzyme S subunit